MNTRIFVTVFKGGFIGLLLNVLPLTNGVQVQTIDAAPKLRGDQLEIVDSLTLDGNNYESLISNSGRALRRARAMSLQSRNQLLHANKIRREINVARLQLRRTNDGENSSSDDIAANIENLNIALKNTQAKGASLRQQSKSLHMKARKAFAQGLQGRFPSWINTLEPLALANQSPTIIAHNAQLRSVHPRSMAQVNAAVADAREREASGDSDGNASLTLALAKTSGQDAPPDLDISRYRLSRQLHYFAYIGVHKTKFNDKENVPLNSIHQWRLLLTDLEGQAISGAKIEVGGHMPGHVHGLPTQPRVTGEIEPGVYRVDGLKFQMRGWWVMNFTIAKPETGQHDTLTFNLVL